MLFDPHLQQRTHAATFRCLAKRTAQKPHADRAPWNETNAVVAECRNHLQLDGSSAEIVEALLRSQAKEVARGSHTLRSGDVPPCKIAAADVGHLAFTD